jgi:hypothetical protein
MISTPCGFAAGVFLSFRLESPSQLIVVPANRREDESGSPGADPSIEHIAEATVQPAFAGCVIAAAVDVLVECVRAVAAEPPACLFQTLACVPSTFVAAVPEFAMPLNRARPPVARGFDHVLVHHFTIDRRVFLMPVHDLRRSISG